MGGCLSPVQLTLDCPATNLGTLSSGELLLLRLDLILSLARNKGGKTDLAIDFLHTLKVGSCGALAPENRVHFFQAEPLGLREEKPDECSAHGR